MRAVGSALRRPAVSASLTLAVLATGAAVVSAQSTAGPGAAAFVLSPEAVVATSSERATASADATRLASERSDLNTKKSAVMAKQQVERAKQEEADRKTREEEAAKAARAQAREDLLKRAPEDPKAATRELMGDFGFGEDQWGCLEQLVTGESTWNYLAVNPTSGAYGLFQSLPAEKMSTVADDWSTNPVTQIKWGLSYIKRSYGTPCNAWNFWNQQSPHWY